ncbi:MAG: hypothetical protein ACTSRS_22075 [Candidatus Helarchaeota archaeon]
MVELFTCQVCKYHLETGGCTKPYNERIPCHYGEPINQVPKTHFKIKTIRARL